MVNDRRLEIRLKSNLGVRIEVHIDISLPTLPSIKKAAVRETINAENWSKFELIADLIGTHPNFNFRILLFGDVIRSERAEIEGEDK
jgi:hypothetical protein